MEHDTLKRERGLLAALGRSEAHDRVAVATYSHEAERRRSLASKQETVETGLRHALETTQDSRLLQRSLHSASMTGLVAPRLLKDAQHHLKKSRKRDLFLHRAAEPEVAPEPDPPTPPSTPRTAAPGGDAAAVRTKRTLCLEFSRTGRCTHGSRCVFAHGTAELAERPKAPAPAPAVVEASATTAVDGSAVTVVARAAAAVTRAMGVAGLATSAAAKAPGAA